jgi:hypothetical protein
MDIPHPEKFAKFVKETGRRPHIDEAIRFAGQIANRTEEIAESRRAHIPNTIAGIVEVAWGEVLAPELTNGKAPLVRDPQVIRSICDVLSNSDYWVHGEAFQQWRESRAVFSSL